MDMLLLIAIAISLGGVVLFVLGFVLGRAGVAEKAEKATLLAEDGAVIINDLLLTESLYPGRLSRSLREEAEKHIENVGVTGFFR